MKSRYYRLRQFFEEKFGRRIWKVSVDAGFECPNQGGCIFCNVTSFSPSRRLDGIAAAIEKEKGTGSFCPSEEKIPAPLEGKRCLSPFPAVSTSSTDGKKISVPSEDKECQPPFSSAPFSSNCEKESIEQGEEEGSVREGDSGKEESAREDRTGKGDRHLLPLEGAGASSQTRQKEPVPLFEQIDLGISGLRRRYSADRFVAYFQPSTNTNAPVEVLREVYSQALAHPAVVGLIVGTRPDCVSDEVIELLDELAQQRWVSLELGLQTIHDRSLAWLGRGHDYAAFLDVVQRCQSCAFDLGAHVILGLPGESREEVLAMADELTRLKIDSVKLHNLYAVRGTPLAAMYEAGEFTFGTLEEYVDLVVGFLERLRPECVIDRISGEAPPDYLVAPAWCAKKALVLHRVEELLENRDTWQGRLVP